jgi:predicted MFS family arabinose efflux permease
MGPQLPYAAIAIGIAVIFGVWAFIVAETGKERAVIAGIPLLVFLIQVIFPTMAGQVISLIGWVIYGIGCIIYLRLNGMEIR